MAIQITSNREEDADAARLAEQYLNSPKVESLIKQAARAAALDEYKRQLIYYRPPKGCPTCGITETCTSPKPPLRYSSRKL